MKPPSHFLATFVVLCVTAAAALAEDAAALAAFKARLLAATTKHLNLLVDDDGSVGRMKGKTADGQGAMAFYLHYELTHEERYRKAALGIADRVLRDMRATKFGVLPIKEKAKPGKDESFIGGGPPAMGFYTANVAYILHREGGRNDDLKYIATVLDQYPWSEGGWWSADIDVKTGESKQPLTKPSPVNSTKASRSWTPRSRISRLAMRARTARMRRNPLRSFSRGCREARATPRCSGMSLPGTAR